MGVDTVGRKRKGEARKSERLHASASPELHRAWLRAAERAGMGAGELLRRVFSEWLERQPPAGGASA